MRYTPYPAHLCPAQVFLFEENVPQQRPACSDPTLTDDQRKDTDHDDPL